jgi:hypothetical protein
MKGKMPGKMDKKMPGKMDKNMGGMMDKDMEKKMGKMTKGMACDDESMGMKNLKKIVAGKTTKKPKK